MWPSLGKIFGEDVSTFFICLMLAFTSAIALCVHWAKTNHRYQVDKDVIIDLGLYAVIFGILGGRLAHVFLDGFLLDYIHLCIDPSKVDWKMPRNECASIRGQWDAALQVCHPLTHDCFAWAKFWQGGLTLYGGIALAVFVCYRVARKERIPIAPTADIVAVAIPLALFFGRVGCFLGGCCYGQVSDVPWAVIFPAGSTASDGQYRTGLLSSPYVPSMPVHPTQLYEAACALTIAAVGYFWVLPRKEREGAVVIFSMVSYGIGRFLIEFLRADDRGGWLHLSTSQWISVAMIVIAAIAFRKLKKVSYGEVA